MDTSHFLPNEDRIARPALGRFFPVSTQGILSLLQELCITSPPYRKRVDLVFQNAKSTELNGQCIAELRHRNRVTINSFPASWSVVRAKAVLETALREIAELDKSTAPIRSSVQFLIFRAYFQEPDCVILTKNLCNIQRGKYRGNSKFSNAFKPKGVKTEETILHSAKIARFAEDTGATHHPGTTDIET